ncbi:MAG: EamA family transporter [Clostridia bacterium]|nr:EamA family transporter [Clostridia bacterium]
MLTAALICMMIVLYSLQSFFCKKYADSYPGRGDLSSTVFTVVSGVTVVAVSLCFMGFRFEAAPLTWLFGVLNALALFGYNYFLVKCSQAGSFTVLQVFAVAGGIIVPTLAAWFGFGVELSPLKWLGVFAVIGGVYLASYKSEKKAAGEKSPSADGCAEAGKPKRAAFIPLCLCLALCNGAYASLTDIQQRLTGDGEKEEMVAVTYGVAAIISLCLLLIKSRGSFTPFKQSRVSLIYLAVTSVIVGVAINILVIVIPLLNDITLLHTFNNSGILVCSAILSYIFFKERFTRINIVGCLIMCCALVLVALF